MNYHDLAPSGAGSVLILNKKRQEGLASWRMYSCCQIAGCTERCVGWIVGYFFNISRSAAPPTGHVFDVFSQYLHILNLELPTYGIVMISPSCTCNPDVESSEVTACFAAVFYISRHDQCLK